MLIARMAAKDGDLPALARFLRKHHKLDRIELSAPTRTLDGMITVLSGHIVYLVDEAILPQRGPRPRAKESEQG